MVLVLVVARRGSKVVGYYLEGLFAAQFLTNLHRIGHYFAARFGFRFSSFLVSFSRISGPIGGQEIPLSETEGNWDLRGGRSTFFWKMEKIHRCGHRRVPHERREVLHVIFKLLVPALKSEVSASVLP